MSLVSSFVICFQSYIRKSARRAVCVCVIALTLTLSLSCKRSMFFYMKLNISSLHWRKMGLSKIVWPAWLEGKSRMEWQKCWNGILRGSSNLNVQHTCSVPSVSFNKIKRTLFFKFFLQILQYNSVTKIWDLIKNEDLRMSKDYHDKILSICRAAPKSWSEYTTDEQSNSRKS